MKSYVVPYSLKPGPRNGESAQKNHLKPKNRYKFHQKRHQKPKTEIKALTDKVLVGFRIFLSVILFLYVNLFYFPKFFLSIPTLV